MKDNFAQAGVPVINEQADYLFELPDLKVTEQVNCAEYLLTKNLDAGRGEEVALIGDSCVWTYSDLDKKTNQIADLLTKKYGLVPGNRALLRGYNNPYTAAVWLAALKAGLIPVTTMPLMRARDLKPVIEKAKIDFVICQSNLIEEIEILRQQGLDITTLVFGIDGSNEKMNVEMGVSSEVFRAYKTTADDVAIIAFTSGTTGNPKGCIHYHRDILAMAVCFSEHVLKPKPEDAFIGTPPLAFTFGLGSLLVFPLYSGATSILIEDASPANLAESIEKYRATICFTSPTGYKSMLNNFDSIDLSSLRISVAAGEHLSPAIYNRWQALTDIKMINGIGSTEMIHIFVSTTQDENLPGLTGCPVPGYQACITDKDANILLPGNEGFLAVKGPTGCKYLNDDRQSSYVINGWNRTGDIFYQDTEGRFWFRGRADEMIVSSGYNISSIEVESVINEHSWVSESAVIGIPDLARGKLVKAFVVLNEGILANDQCKLDIQNFVKQETSPYKYPRSVEFVSILPKTSTGKIQRHKLA